MNTDEDFFVKIMQLDSNYPDIATVRLVQQNSSAHIIKARELEIEQILCRLSESLDHCLATSESFREWFEILTAGLEANVPARQQISPAFIIEAFREPTGYVCLTIDRIKLQHWHKPKYAFGLWHRRTEYKFVYFETISWTDSLNILTYLRRFPTDREGLSLSLYCSSQFPPLFS